MAYVFLNMALRFKQTNQWPLSFADLDQERIAGHRLDPFSGKDLLFAPIRTRAALYSVGPNGVDDKYDETKDVGYWAFVRKDKTTIEKEEDLISSNGTGKPAPAKEKNGAEKPEHSPE